MTSTADKFRDVLMDEIQEMLVQGFKPDGIISHVVNCYGLTDAEAVEVVDATANHPITKIILARNPA